MRPLPLLLALALAGPAGAQSLDADVVRDPDAGLAIYTATVQGPPGGNYALFASLSLAPAPFALPGVFGTIYLDPFAAIQLTGLSPLDPFGLGFQSLSLPLVPWQDATIGFQALVVDPLAQLAVTDLGSAAQGSTPSPSGGLQYESRHATSTNLYTLRLTGNPGTPVRLLINGGLKGDVPTNLDAGGAATVTLPVPLVQGDQFTLEELGLPVHTWSHY